MRTTLAILTTLVLAGPSLADDFSSGYIMPKAGFRELLEIAARLSNKQVVVEREDEMKHMTSMVLPGPVSSDTRAQGDRCAALAGRLRTRRIG